MFVLAKSTIRISNHTFTITSDDDQQYLDSITTKVENRVKRLADEMPNRNLVDVALFVAMDYCDQYTKAKGDGSDMRTQIKDYLQESSFLRKKLDEATRENEKLKAEIETLRNRMSSENVPKQAVEEIPERIGKAEPSKPASLVKKDRAILQKEPAVTPDEETEEETVFDPVIPQVTESAENNEIIPTEEKDSAPVSGDFENDPFGESADAAAEIMSFFEQNSLFDDED